MSKQHNRFPLLRKINSPEGLRRLPEAMMKDVANELREFLIETVAESTGHFGAGLGALELTVALHYVFETPKDRLVWDVGHQSYPHKILTGRRDEIHTVRKSGGITPFPKRSESEYDTFGVGHAGTSIGAAQGIAEAFKLLGIEQRVIAVIGDGAMTAGMAFEAMNHAGEQGTDILVILNDNEMSISPNVGALSNYFARVISGKIYSTVREGSKKVLERVPPMWELARRAEEHVKGMIIPGTLFEELGFSYFGPIDGHDISALIATLKNLRPLKGPRLLHVVTKKGKGYGPAEADPVKYHAIGTPMDPKIGVVSSNKTASPTYSQIFGEWLCDMAAIDERLIGITPAMREGSGLVKFAADFPDRYFDVAIAEQHSVTLAAGMACEGLKPVVAIYSTFLQRAYDQLIHDVVIQKLPVLFAIDRAGVVGGDGPTHAGTFDIAYLRCLPELVLMTPADENECRQMLYTGFTLDQPAAVRYPRGKGPGVAIEHTMTALQVGKAEIRREGHTIAILAFGAMLHPAMDVGNRFDATVVNMRFVKPIDDFMISKIAKTHQFIVTIDESSIFAGAGSAVNESLAEQNIQIPVLNHGLPDRFIEHGEREEMLRDANLDADGLHAAIDLFMAKHLPTIAAPSIKSSQDD